MHFCPECGMRISKIIKENGEIYGLCLNGHRTHLKSSRNNLKITTERGKRNDNQQSGIVVISEKQRFQEGAGIPIACPHCGARRCKLLTSFMFAGDEENVNIMRCLNCGKNFRVGVGLPGH